MSAPRLPAAVLVLLALTPLLHPRSAASALLRGITIEDFESGPVVLRSYPDQDRDPDAWEVTRANAHGGIYALRIYGNSWKIQDIAPVAVADSTVWQVAVFVEDLGEIQASGVGDGVNELLYTMAGEQLPQASKWRTVYRPCAAVHRQLRLDSPVGGSRDPVTRRLLRGAMRERAAIIRHRARLVRRCEVHRMGALDPG